MINVFEDNNIFDNWEYIQDKYLDLKDLCIQNKYSYFFKYIIHVYNNFFRLNVYF